MPCRYHLCLLHQPFLCMPWHLCPENQEHFFNYMQKRVWSCFICFSMIVPSEWLQNKGWTDQCHSWTSCFAAQRPSAPVPSLCQCSSWAEALAPSPTPCMERPRYMCLEQHVHTYSIFLWRIRGCEMAPMLKFWPIMNIYYRSKVWGWYDFLKMFLKVLIVSYAHQG